MIGRLSSSPASCTPGCVTVAPLAQPVAPVAQPVATSRFSTAIVPTVLPTNIAAGYVPSSIAAPPFPLQAQATPPPHMLVGRTAVPTPPLALPNPVTPLPAAAPVAITSAVQTKTEEAESLARTIKYNQDILRTAGFAANVTLPPANEDPRGDYLENMKYVGEREPWLAPNICQARRRRLGLDAENTQKFCKASEFISLGCQCVPARTMQALDLRRSSYPLDWARTPVKGVMHLFQTRFQDLFETTGDRHVDEATGSYVIQMKWGGSCVHHDPEVPKTRADFARRAERLLGSGTVLPSQTRVFVRAVNSSAELQESLPLFTVLKQALPEACCYLLVIVDFQSFKGPVQPAFKDLIHYCISKDVYEDGQYSMEKHCEAYAEAISFAIKAWSGDSVTWKAVREAPQMAAVCQRFTGGDPSKEFFHPVRY